MLVWLRRVLGPVARLLVALGNAVTPGEGYRDGPFDSEAELRDLVDLAGETALIEAGERQMIHSVFELGDTVVREVMVPRTDMVTIDADKTLKQAMSLFLRSGFSRIPVVGDGPDDVLGLLYFKDVTRRVNADAGAGDGARAARDAARSTTSPRASRSTTCCARCSAASSTSPWSSTSTAARPAWSPSRTSSRRSSARSPTSTTGSRPGSSSWRTARPGCRPRMHVDDLAELFGVTIEEEEVDTVGGLLGKTHRARPDPGVDAARSPGCC